MSSISGRFDIYETITNQIISDLERGVRSWVQPWNNVGGVGFRPVNKDFKPYSGINVLILWLAAEARGYSDACWMTFKQACDLGGKVRKGETGTKICYYQPAMNGGEAEEDGAETQRKGGFLKVYTVFNVAQIDGLPDQYKAASAPAPAIVSENGRVAHVDAFVAATKADIRSGGNKAFFSPSADFIQMPPLAAFNEAQDYYATLLHELAHWTSGGKGSRLEREFGRKRWGDAGYAMEELVAELAAAFLCADLGLNLVEREDHSSYIASWLKVLKNDKRAIFTAAAHAQRAAQFLHDLQPKHANDDAEGDELTEETPRLAA